MVTKKIKAMKGNKSHIVGEIPPQLRIETVELIIVPRAKVLNLSFKRELFLLNENKQTPYHYLRGF